MVTVKNDQYADELARDQFDLEPGITTIIRLMPPDEQEEEATNEPLKLLVVNSNTVPVGLHPIGFPAYIDKESGAWYPKVIIIEVTPDEFEKIRADPSMIPRGWKMGKEYVRPMQETC